MSKPLSIDLDDPNGRPYFLWSEDITFAGLRQRLASADLDERRTGVVDGACHARGPLQDVFRLLHLTDVLLLWSRIDRHLGRSRPFWHWLIEGWRTDGLLPAA